MMRDIQAEIVELLQADPYFADIAGIVSRRKGSISEQVAEALSMLTANASGQIGVAVIVIIADAVNEKPNIPGPFWHKITPSLIVMENPTLNNIGKNADEVTEYATAVLHQRLLDATGTTLLVKRKVLFAASADDPQAPNGYELQLETSGGLQYQPGQVATPVVN